MRLLFVSRATLFTNPGGDTIQIKATAQCLKNLGVDVDIKLANEKIEYGTYDMIHFFNIIRPADILRHIKNTDKPYVISTIFVDYSEFERKNASGLRRIISRFLSPDMIEYLKVVARAIWNKERIGSNYYLMHGQRRSIRKVTLGATMLLPNSENEYMRLRKRYGVDSPYLVVPNGIDVSKFGNDTFLGPKDPKQVLCVGRLEPLKNQLNLIKALANSDFHLRIIGKASANHKKYFEECKAAAGSNVEFIDYLPQEQLLKYYQQAKVHVLPSWFETTGLSSLEAAACGCNVVITDKGDAREYFGNFAFYCDPALTNSIFDAVTLASTQPVNPDFAQYVIKHYNWENAASGTFAAYKQVISKTRN